MDLRDGVDKQEAAELNTAAKAYGRYGTLGIQMVVMLAVGIWGGLWLDGHTGWKFPLFTLLGVFLGIGGGLWFLFKETRKRK